MALTARDQFCDLDRSALSSHYGHLTRLRLCYRRDGNPTDPALVLIAGLGQNLTVWPDSFVEQLVSEGFHVIRFDNRDAGRSSRIPSAPPNLLRLLFFGPRRDWYDLATMAEDTVALLDHLGIGSAHLVGLSMGAMIAQTVAARFPRYVDSLTSIFSTTGARNVGQPAFTTKLLMVLPAPRTCAEAVVKAVTLKRHVAGEGVPFDPAAAADYAKRSWKRGGGNGNTDGIARQFNAILASGDLTSELRSITAPTLVIHGDSNRMVHPSGGTATAAAIPGARLELIKGMGHDLAAPLLDTLADLVAAHTTIVRPPASEVIR
jgi:pimeloyl-ACP methyl ester carboxylesterase